MSFWTTAADQPDRIAVVEDGGETTTYGELATLSWRLANGLADLGVGPGDVVAALLSNRVEFLALQLATHVSGVVFAPLNRHLTGPEAAYILADSGAALMVADAASAAAVAEAADLAALPETSRFCVQDLPGFRPFDHLLGSSSPRAERTSGSLLLYSSGTTGKPKGIRKPVLDPDPDVEAGLMATRVTAMGMTPRGVYLAVGPLYHSAPNQHTFAALQLEQTVVLSGGFDPRHVLSLIAQHGVTDAFLVATMLHRLLTVPVEERAAYDVSSMRIVLLSGAMCPVPTKRAMIEWWGPIFFEYYGASETGMVTMIDSATWLEHPGSVGRPKPGAEVRVCDPDGRDLPAGEVGLLHLKSGTTFEYNADPDKTASSHRDGFFIPGDLGYVDEDGFVYLADRRTDMIISGGVNIYPAEIEAELLQHPDVLDAVVIGVPDPEWGHAVVALVQPREEVVDLEGLPDAVLEHCRGGLAKFKLPRRVEVVAELPRTPSGKLARSRVRDDYVAAQAVRS